MFSLRYQVQGHGQKGLLLTEVSYKGLGPKKEREMNGSIRKRGRNNRELRFDLPSGPDVTDAATLFYVRGSKADAQRRLRELVHQLDTGLPPTMGNETVSVLMARWHCC